nr:hypothetical protein [Mycoplasmopsis bovis]
MAHLNLIIQYEVTFSQWSRKGKLKVAKILPYFTLDDLYTKWANLS